MCARMRLAFFSLNLRARPTLISPLPQKKGIEFLKSRGQHILKNPMVVQAIVDKGEEKDTERERERERRGLGRGALRRALP